MKFLSRMHQKHRSAAKPQKTNLYAETKSGFTIIELTITMSFVAILLITIAVVTTNILAIYQKGLTLKAVNSVGRSLVDEFTSAINAAPSVDTTNLCKSLITDEAGYQRCVDNHANLFIYQTTSGEAGDLAEGQVQYNGIFCTGRYSYLWNTYYGVETGRILRATYLDESTGTKVTTSNVPSEAVRLMRFEDRNYRLCDQATSSEYKSTLGTSGIIDISEATGSTNDHYLPNPIPTPEEGLLDEFDLDLMLYELSIFPISQDAITLRTYVSGTFILATLRGDVDITRSGDYCKVDYSGSGAVESSGTLLDLGSEFNYCGINKFNFAARTAGAK